MGAAGDQLLSERVLPVWKGFAPTDRVYMASSLMDVLEQGANLLATYLQRNSQSFTYTNWGSYLRFFTNISLSLSCLRAREKYCN